MNKTFLLLSGGEVYLPDEIRANQMHPVRQMYMLALIQNLSEKKKHLKILEVGSYAGGSAVTMLSGVNQFFDGNCELWCCDEWKPYYERDLETKPGFNLPQDSGFRMDLSVDLAYEIFRYNVEIMGYQDKVFTLRGDSRKVLPMLKPKVFDLIYVDGDHRYEVVKEDLKNAKRLVKPDGIICGDDLEVAWPCYDPEAANADIVKGLESSHDPATGMAWHPGVSKAVHEELAIEGHYEGFWAAQAPDFTTLSITGKLIMPNYLTEKKRKIIDDYIEAIRQMK